MLQGEQWQRSQPMSNPDIPSNFAGGDLPVPQVCVLQIQEMNFTPLSHASEHFRTCGCTAAVVLLHAAAA